MWQLPPEKVIPAMDHEQALIVETIVTTRNEDGTINIAPMGPSLSPDFRQFELRPFQGSTTFSNLRRTRCGVIHITDDVLLFAQAVTKQWDAAPAMKETHCVEGRFLESVCRYFEFKVSYVDESSARSRLNCEVVHACRLRDFIGFNRAKHAVLETAIVATRLDFLPQQEVAEAIERMETIVGKTGGPREIAASNLLIQYLKVFGV